MTLAGDLPQSSLKERMQKVHMRMYVEETSGVSVKDKELFLFLCQQHEAAHPLAEEESSYREMNWKDFGNWHDAPLFVLERGKVRGR